MARRFIEKKHGPKQSFDHEKIKEWFRAGKRNREIAELAGYTPEYIRQLRVRYTSKKCH